MAFLPRIAMGEFTPLFRMLDDYASHQISRGLPSAANSAITTPAFQPRFDVKETKTGYELHGELPGVSQKDVDIEFTDPQTLKISGRVERRTEIGQRPGAPAIEAQPESAATLHDSSSNSHQPAVEDESTVQTTSHSGAETTVARSDNTTNSTEKPSSRYWLSERSIGQFQRTFNFPDRVDAEAVRASLRDGILSVIVPKAQEMAKRRINIE